MRQFYGREDDARENLAYSAGRNGALNISAPLIRQVFSGRGSALLAALSSFEARG